MTVPPSIQSVGIRRDAHGLEWVELLGVPSSRYSYPPSCSDSRCCFCHRESGRLRRTQSYFCGASSSRALHRFIIGTDRSPGWFRILPRYCGRTGRLRRTGRNPLCSDRFLLLDTAACHLNPTVGHSDQACEQWTASRSDGAYPRPEVRGIAPVPLIST